MYGLIHSAMQRMVIEGFGESVWDSILETASLSDDVLLTMRSYEDEVTLSLIHSASQVLKLPTEVLLESFGQYWIESFAAADYGAMLEKTGRTPLDFLRNLDDLHDRIATVFTEFSPPSFKVEELDGCTKVHYRSSRIGLSPFVVGLLAGLGSRFDTPLRIVDRHQVEVEKGEHTVFFLELE